MVVVAVVVYVSVDEWYTLRPMVRGGREGGEESKDREMHTKKQKGGKKLGS